MKRNSLKRFIVYPLIIGIMTNFVFELLSGFEYGRIFINDGPLSLFDDLTGITLDFEVFKYYLFYIIGYTYGSISTILPLHKMKLGVIGLVLMYIKYWACLVILSPFAMMIFPFELLFRGIRYLSRSLKKVASYEN